MFKKIFLFFLGLILAANLSYGYALQSLAGNVIFEKDIYKNPKAILLFWASWCPHCVQQMGNLKKEQIEMKKEGIKIFLIDAGEPERRVLAVKKKYDLKCPIIIDNEGYLFSKYGVFGIPTLIYLKNGKPVGREFYLDMDEVKEIFKDVSGK